MGEGERGVAFDRFAREALGGDDPGWEPYPWQVRLAERCAAADAEPPAWVVAPTGAGKTVAVEALVWALAQQADLAPAERTATTRIVWAIDRRLLVDEVHERARALADRLDDALDDEEDILHGTALRLFRLACANRAGEPPPREERLRRGLRPLAVQRWRGGIASREQLLRPFQPQIITSTVAQIGSRLLFRGYGVGRRSLQVAAGLAATDTTICLDEAHLAVPFLETAKAVRRVRSGTGLRLPPFNVITLTATPPASADLGSTIELDEGDYARLGKRWRGEKALELREGGSAAPEKALTSAVSELLAEGRRVVGCVVNQVRTARRVVAALKAKLAPDADVVLLVGPQRPADRERELAAVRGALLGGEAPERPLVVVATQTIEVGLDADFDGMVTQSASASALVQRLGRLNRSGDRPGRCIVLRDASSSLYQHDEPGAWEWLQGLPGAPAAVDVSVAALSADDSRPGDRSPALAPTLTPAVVAQLSQTSPRPAPLADPDVEPFLKGIGAERRGDAQIVWRRDLRFSLDEPEGDRPALRAYRETLLTLAPPEPREALAVSVGDARRLLRKWLADPRDPRARGYVGEGADIEGGELGAEAPIGPPVGAPFIVVRGRQVLHGVRTESGKETIAPGELAPGDVIVVPTIVHCGEPGAIATGPGWYRNDVMADRAAPPGDAAAADRLAIRFSWEALTPSAPHHADAGQGGPSPRRWLEIARALDSLNPPMSRGRTLGAAALCEALGAELESLPQPCREWLAALAESEARVRLQRVTTPPARELLEEAADRGDSAEGARSRPGESAAEFLARVSPHFTQAWVLTRARPAEAARQGPPSPPPTLAAHSAAVRERARRFGSWLQLPPEQQQALELAALAHDIGKLNPSFQDFLRAGSAVAVDEPLAKSVFGTENAAAARVAREQANLPRGLRHEASSVEILASALEVGAVPADLTGAEPGLSLTMAGVSHGEALPLWPVEDQRQPAIGFTAELLGIAGQASGTNRGAWLGGRWLQMLLDVQDRYGHWGFAYLATLLVLADRTVSQEGS